MPYITILIFPLFISTQIFAQTTPEMMTVRSIQSISNQQQLQGQTLSFTRPPLAGSFISFNPDQHTTRSQSWQKLKDQHMIKPDHDFSCGAVAMIALLNDDDQQNFIQQQLFSSIGQKDGPASFIDRQKVLNELDIQAQGYAISLHRLQQLQIPVISAINQDFVRLTHPSLGQKMRSVHPLKRIWLTHAIDGTKGKILLIVPKEVVLETPKNLVFFRTSQKFIAVDIFDHLRCSSIAPDMIFYDVTQKKSGIESQYLNESSNRFIDDKSLLNLLN